jgi:hypothetical protein
MFAAGKTKGVVATAANYIEDVFSTYLYTGNGGGSNNPIVNGVDISNNGGLVWIKNRSSATQPFLFDTNRGMGFAIQPPFLSTNTTNAQSATLTDYIRADTTGFTIGSNATGGSVNASGSNYASWTFRKQPKFFDVVTYTGTGSATTIAHNLGSVPGCIIVKQTSASGNYWTVYHTSLGNTQRIFLNTTDPSETASSWNNTTPTSTVFSVGTSAAVNGSGSTYVAYLFAHNAGGFGLTGTDNVISCGSFTTDGSGNASVTLGYEPQWVLTKLATGASQWLMVDTMRGDPVLSQPCQYLCANLSNAEATTGAGVAQPTSTGFNGSSFDVGTHIYIAIRRGPMKVPTDATKVFNPTANAGTGSTKFITTNFPVDLTIQTNRNDAQSTFTDRLRGGGANASPRVYSQFTDAESNTSAGRGINFDSNTGVTNLLTYNNGVGDNFIYYAMQRAPGFFDEVCFTDDGTGTQVVKHNLGVVPELQILKVRSNAQNWPVYITSGTLSLKLNLTDAAGSQSLSPTSTQFTAPGYPAGWTVVSYLFATCAGVSKVGSYTGNGTTQTINCGFTGGARFVLIKRTDSTGDWYVYDTARGMTVLTDPYLLLNSTAAESATLGSVTTVSTGFAVNASILAAINTNSASYIFLAIA